MGFLHLFFLFVPTYLLSMAVYITLAKSMGAGDNYAKQEAEYHQEQKERDAYHAELAKREAAQQTEVKPASMLEKVSGAIALASLAAMVISALKVWGAGADYQVAFESFKAFAIYPTIIYFISATTWITLRDKA